MASRKYRVYSPEDTRIYGSINAARVAAWQVLRNPKVKGNSVYIVTAPRDELDREIVGQFFKFQYFNKDLRVLGPIGVWLPETGGYRYVKRDGSLGRSANDLVPPAWRLRAWHTTSPCSRAAGRKSVHSSPYPRPARRRSSGSIGSRMPWAATSAPLWRSTERA